MKIYLTIDVEPDCPPYLSTFRGIEEGLPKLLNYLKIEKIPATFFVTGEVARKFPEAVRSIVENDHELGCHGDSHLKFTEFSRSEAEQDIRTSLSTLRSFSAVTSFRAPYLLFPDDYVDILLNEKILIDSSEGSYKKRGARLRLENDIIRVPASVTSSVLRLPRLIRNRFFARLKEPIVLFVHPWEFVDFRRSSLRYDCRFRTGDTALRCLHQAIGYFQARSGEFSKIGALPTDLGKERISGTIPRL